MKPIRAETAEAREAAVGRLTNETGRPKRRTGRTEERSDGENDALARGEEEIVPNMKTGEGKTK